MTRDDLFNTNISIVCDIIKVIGQVSPNALVGIISNPVSISMSFTSKCVVVYKTVYYCYYNFLKGKCNIYKICFSLLVVIKYFVLHKKLIGIFSLIVYLKIHFIF